MNSLVGSQSSITIVILSLLVLVLVLILISLVITFITITIFIVFLIIILVILINDGAQIFICTYARVVISRSKLGDGGSVVGDNSLT